MRAHSRLQAPEFKFRPGNLVARPELQLDEYYHPSSFEVASGWVYGRNRVPGLKASSSEHPRTVLRSLLVPALAAGPTFVMFSGGRDSSAVLAAATDAARREGLPAPIPVTERYPGVTGTDETEWQELVVKHLGLVEWVRVDATQSMDLLGEGAQDSLLRRGVLWPATLHSKAAWFSELGLGPGTLLTGEGGDEVFNSRRATSLYALRLRAGGPRRRDRLRWVAQNAAPRPARRRYLTAYVEKNIPQPWLPPAIRQRSVAMSVRDLAAEPFGWDSATLGLAGRRGVALGTHNYRLVAREYGLSLMEPFLEHAFLAAVAGFGGRRGLPTRTAWMESLFGDVLPETLLRRRTKAYFNHAFYGAETQRFARAWDGTGLDPDLVDTGVLQRDWLSDFPSAKTSMMLHTAWLATQAIG